MKKSTMCSNRYHLIFCVLILSVSITFSLVAVEVVLRKIDGHPLMRLSVASRQYFGLGLRSRISPEAFLNNNYLADNVEAGWFMYDPEPLPQRPKDPFLLFLMERAKGTAAEKLVVKQINRVFLLDQFLNNGPFYGHFMQYPDEAVVFEPCDDGLQIGYRNPPNVTLPSGLSTNSLGWRGPDIGLNKPDNTIRLCFLGASTTAGLPQASYSYPEYIGNWLNIWAQKNNLDIRFEIMNTARPGFTSPGIADVFKGEALPLEPDFVIYYEGANQFDYRSMIDNVGDMPGPLQYERKHVANLIDKAARYSVLAQRLKLFWIRLHSDFYGAEPEKPSYFLNFPDGIDADNPDISRTDLPLNLSDIMQDLDKIYHRALFSQCEFAVVSFVWLPYEGMVLDPVQHRAILWYLNSLHWPLRYADCKRLADFQNRVFEQYARARGINFIDLSARFPREPDFFFDAIHFNEDGIRLQAWIILQELVPLIRARICLIPPK